MWQAFNIQRKEDKRLLPYMIGAFVLIVGVSVAVGVWAGGFTMITLIPLGVVLGGLVTFIIFGRRAQRSIYRKAEGQTGAAAWVLDNLRGKWRVTPGVAATGHFDAVHRVLGRPGVILVGEGSAARVKPLLAQEKKRTARLVGDVPIYDIIVGNGEGEVPLGKLERHLTRLPAQHHRQANGRAGVAVGRAGIAGRCRRHAKGTATQRRQDARCAAHRAPQVAHAGRLQRRTTAVPVSPILQPAPVPVGEQRRDDRPTSSPRTASRPIPTGTRPSTATTCRPSANCPGVKPNSRTATTPSTNQMTSTAVANIGSEKTPNPRASAARP